MSVTQTVCVVEWLYGNEFWIVKGVYVSGLGVIFEIYKFRNFPEAVSPLRTSFTDEGWNFNSGNYLFTTDTK